jgi:diguanylate cyclase (GGDEF)-like protein
MGYATYGLFSLQADGPVPTLTGTSAATQTGAPVRPAGRVAIPAGTSDIDGRLVYLTLIAIAMLMIVTSSLELYLHCVRYVRHDIESLARMFHDLRDGNIRVDYPLRLREFSTIFDYLRHSGAQMLEEKLRFKKMGLVDHLSQLNNRRHFEKRLQNLHANARVNGPSSVLLIDVDHFKQVNDQHGHDIGDALIVAFSAALRKVVRKTDFLARLGGDEFCIIYVYTGLDKSRALVERLRRELPRHVELPKGIVHNLRWTGGLSAMRDSDAKFDDVLWRADQALLQAKEQGRNNTRVFPAVAAAPRKKMLHAN